MMRYEISCALRIGRQFAIFSVHNSRNVAHSLEVDNERHQNE